MRQELGEANHKLTEMEQVVRKAERSLDVSRLDHSDLSASLAANVGKLDTCGNRGLSISLKSKQGGADKNFGSRFAHYLFRCCLILI
jgi:hypothetical protein